MLSDLNKNYSDSLDKSRFISVFSEFSFWIKNQYSYNSKSLLEKKVLDSWLAKPSTYLKFGFITSQKLSFYEYTLLGMLYSVPEELDSKTKSLIGDYLNRSSALQRMYSEFKDQLKEVPEVFLK